jgi:hypothetical protein
MLISSLDSKLGPEVRDREKIKTFVASKPSSVPTYQVPFYDRFDPLLGELRRLAPLFLAAMLDPEKLRSKDPGPAIQRAVQLLNRLSEYLPFEALSTGQERALISKGIDDDIRAMQDWKMVKGSWLTFEQFIEQFSGTSDCKYKSVRELREMLKRVKFPFLKAQKRPSDFPFFLPAGQITLEAYRLALKQDALLQKKGKLERQRKRRAKQVQRLNKQNRSASFQACLASFQACSASFQACSASGSEVRRNMSVTLWTCLPKRSFPIPQGSNRAGYVYPPRFPTADSPARSCSFS